MLTIASDKYYVVVGLGLTGLSVVHYLHARNLKFCVVDTRENPPGLKELQDNFPAVPVYLKNFDSEVLLNAYALVLSPGVDRNEKFIRVVIDKGVAITSDVELFLKETKSKVVGVTGSNGKSTVVTLLGKIAEAQGLSSAVGGNIGVPALDLLSEKLDWVILELSSFQLENIKKANLEIACVLNVSSDHMDRHVNMEAYFRAKQRIYFGAKKIVYNLEDQLTIPPRVEGVSRAGFSLRKSREENETQFWFDVTNRSLMCKRGELLRYADMQIKGLHNVANALAVIAICEFMNIDSKVVVEQLKSFRGLPHRSEWVKEWDGVTYVNDSKATNVGAAEAAVLGLKDEYANVVLIAGGDGKGADFTSLAELIRKYVSALILIGRDGELIAKVVGDSVEKFYAINMLSAVEVAKKIAKPGSLVLLSPACASFDMYSGYEERGREFVKAVETLCA